MRKAYGGEAAAAWTDAADTLEAACASRPPPLTPAALGRRLAEVASMVGAQIELASAVYSHAFTGAAASGMRTLDYGGDGWSAESEQLASLCEALPQLAALRKLSLARNPIAADGAAMLGAALGVLGEAASGSALAVLDLSFTEIGADGAASLALGLAASTNLTEVDVRGNYLSDEGAVALATALGGSASRALRLAALAVDTNGIRSEGAVALARCCASRPTLTRLSLADNLLKDEGACALAAALNTPAPSHGRVGLRVLDVQKNGIGDRGARALEACGVENCVLGVLVNKARTASGRFDLGS